MHATGRKLPAKMYPTECMHLFANVMTLQLLELVKTCTHMDSGDAEDYTVEMPLLGQIYEPATTEKSNRCK